MNQFPLKLKYKNGMVDNNVKQLKKTWIALTCLEENTTLQIWWVQQNTNEMIIEITFSYDDSTFPLLMPKVKPAFPETYMCTPVKIKDDTFFINGFSPKVS